MTEFEKRNKDVSTLAARICWWSLYAFLIPASFAFENDPVFNGCSIIDFPPVASEVLVQGLQEIGLLDFFVGPSMQTSSEVMACGVFKDKLLQFLRTNKIQYKVLVEDIPQTAGSRDYFTDLPPGTMDWTSYHGLENIYTFLDKVVKDYPKLMSMEVIGTTYENREIRAYKIEKTGGSSSLKATYFECLIHAREWTISGVCTYIINELTAYSSKYAELLDKMRFYIVPVVNPDGFVYTNGTGKSLWRKNRRPIPGNENITCMFPKIWEPIGVDLNRNWPFEWQPGPDPCRENYPGVQGYVENEIKAVTDFLLSHKDIDTFIDIHCFSQLVLLPWAYTKDRVSDWDELLKLGETAAELAKSINGTVFEPVQISIKLGVAGGSSVDWAYGVRKLKYAFGLEMRPIKKVALAPPYIYPFRVPLDQVLPTIKEAWLLVQVLALKKVPDYLSVGARLNACTGLLPALLQFCYLNMGYGVRHLSF